MLGLTKLVSIYHKAHVIDHAHAHGTRVGLICEMCNIYSILHANLKHFDTYVLLPAGAPRPSSTDNYARRREKAEATWINVTQLLYSLEWKSEGARVEVGRG